MVKIERLKDIFISEIPGLNDKLLSDSTDTTSNNGLVTLPNPPSTVSLMSEKYVTLSKIELALGASDWNGNTAPRVFDIILKKDEKKVETKNFTSWSNRSGIVTIEFSESVINEIVFVFHAMNHSTYMQLNIIKLYGNLVLSNNKILLLSEKDNEIKRIEHSVFEVPDMTSITSPSGIVKSSSHRHASYHNYMAFDGYISSRWEADARVNSWVSYTFDEPVIINKYKIYSDGSTGMPKEFRFEVSDDEIEWVILDNQDINLSEWTLNGWNTFKVKRTETKSFRVFAVNNNGGSYIRIPEIQIEGTVLKIVNTPSQSEQSFINHGMSQADLASIDMSTDFSEKHYIQNHSVPLDSGKVFKQPLDVDKIIKSVKIT